MCAAAGVGLELAPVGQVPRQVTPNHAVPVIETDGFGDRRERVVVTVQDHGNTSAASIQLALSVAKAAGQLKENHLIVTEAIGGGLAWGAVVLRW